MAESPGFPVIAVDVGNTRTKFGVFDDPLGTPLPIPVKTFSLSGIDGDLAQLRQWLETCESQPLSWWIASVNRPACSRLIDWLHANGYQRRIRLLASFDLPLQVAVDRPDMVGIDRLAGAVAANMVRDRNRSCVVVDLGTAITVDLVDGGGTFLGGAILPGIGMSARAMHEFTDLLPLLEMETLAHAPAAVGRSTIDAMRSGLYWGAIGAARELINRFRHDLPQDPQILLTGGAAASVAPLLAPSALYVPHLVLAGIAISVAAVTNAT